MSTKLSIGTAAVAAPGPYFRAPCQPIAVWRSDPSVKPPGAKLRAALEVLGEHLWPTMQKASWWFDGTPERCIWATCAAAAFLELKGIRAEVVSAIIEVYATDSAGRIKLPLLSIGYPVRANLKDGIHNVVLIHDEDGSWLLETSLWQGHRPRFGKLPEMVLVDVLPEPCPTPLPVEYWGPLDTVLDAHVREVREDHTVGLGWRLLRRRRNWIYAPDAQPKRAKTVASMLAAFRSAA